MKESSKKEDRPLYSSRIIDTYIRLVRRKYSYVNIRELLDSAKMEPYEVADQGHWFTQEQINLFYEKLLEATDNEQIAREAGRYAASAEAIGVMRQYLLGMVGPAKIYEMIGKASANFTKSSLFESKKIASHKVEICVKPLEGVSEKPFQCENRIGFFEAASMIFDTKLPRIEHPECLFKGGNLCRYIISWEETYSSLWKRIRNHAALFLFLTCLVVVFVDPSITLKVVLPVSAVVVLVLTLIGEYIGKEELKASLYNLSDSSDKLLEQIEINYNNAVMTNEIGQAISKHTTMEDVLAKVIQVSEKRLNYDRGLILLVNPEKTRLLFRAGFGYNEDRFGLLKRTAFHLDRPESRGVFIVSFKEQKPFLINDIREIEHYFSQRSLEFAKKMGTQSFICCPIICDGESIGVFAVDCVKSKRPLVASDLSLLLGIASVIGINIRNADLLEAKAKQFRSMIQVLAASIDARDPMTAGHSEKVTEYASGICDQLGGLSKDYCEMIQVAALLHDYGKIAIPDSILKKEGKLTDEEYEVVKSHADKTREILEQVYFEGMFSQVPEVAGAHHEKIDGSGYPRGLKGDEIPLGARIIAVADFFEAITAKRHYRDPMPLDVALKMLREERGIHFDKKAVDAFLTYYAKSHQNLPRKVINGAFLGES